MPAAMIQIPLSSPMRFILLKLKFICVIDPEASAQPVVISIVNPVVNLAKLRCFCHRMNSILAGYDEVYVAKKMNSCCVPVLL